MTTTLAPGGKRVAAVMTDLRERIASRSLLPGARVPSIRAMTQAVGVSKSTVVDAYERLAAEGAIVPRRGSGFFVSGHAPPLALADLGPRLDREIDPLWLSRQSLETASSALKPGCGWLPTTWLPGHAVRRALRAAARDAKESLVEYAVPAGLSELRQHLTRRLAHSGIGATPEQLLLTDGATQALDLVCRFLLEPGDTVLLDDPCYFNFQALLRAHRVKIVGVPYTPAGPNLSSFADALRAHRPRLYVTNSAIHNPTGASLTPAVAHGLLKLAAEHQLLIVEDDIFADFESQPAPRLAALDGLDRVIAIGSFSKTLSAAVRCGYIAARAEWMEPLIDLKLATCYGSSSLAASVIHRLLTDGAYRRHLDELRAKLGDAMSDSVRRLRIAGLEVWTRPAAGMFLWARLPEGRDAARIARYALEHNVVFAPGSVFSPLQGWSDYLRFNVSQCNRPKVFETLQRALDEVPVSAS